MKTCFKLTALILALITVLASFTACNNSNNKETNNTESESNTELSTENTASFDLSHFPENAFPIFDGSSYVSKVVTSDTADSTERQIAASLRSAFKSKTKVTLSTSTDFLAAGEVYDENAYEIIVGKTKHAESIKVYEAMSYNGYGITVVGKKIIFYFSTMEEGKKLISLFTAAIKITDKGGLWVPDSISVTKNDAIELKDVPKYPAANLATVDCADNTSMVVASKTTLEVFNQYCSTLLDAGYTEYSKRENIDGNYFRTYTKGTTALTVYFSEGTKQTRIIAGPLKDIPSKEIDQTPETVEPSLTFVAQSNRTENGLALIYQLPNGKFIIIDGGYYLSDKIYKELKILQPDTTKITIAAWFVSHPHIDHQDSLENFINQHANEIVIENIFFNYLQPEYYDNLTANDQSESSKEGARVTRFRNLIENKLSSETNVIKPHTGQIYNFGKSAQVEILWTIEDYLPTALDRINTSSLIIRVTVAGSSTIILADSTSVSNELILKMYNSHLKSDMVTLAHHGIWVDTPEMYNRIKAPVLLWPSNTTRAIEFYNTEYSKPAIQAALDNATDVYLSMGTTNKFMLPYQTVNNKEAFMKDILTAST